MKKFAMMFLCVAMIISFACPYVGAEEIHAASAGVTYDNHDIIKEVAYAFDRQGSQILYDQLGARRHIYASPEDATAQRTIYLDCTSYVNACYREAFGVNVMPMEIEQSNSGSSPQSLKMTTYAKENSDNVDVVGYWENADYTTDEDKQALMDSVRSQLEIGDVLVYRHGKTGDSSGHAYIYVGDDTFLHCYGGGSYYRDTTDLTLSYDNNSSDELTGGRLNPISGACIFEDVEHKRYIFKETESDTVRNFCVLRPLARGLTPTEETLGRMTIAGLSMEKTASVFENSAVCSGDVITYTVTLQNTNLGVISGVVLTDAIPEGTEFVSGSNGVSFDGKAVKWSGDVSAKNTVTVTYDVRVTATAPGTLIKSDSTYVNGVNLGNITHSVSGYGKAYGLILGEIAREYAEEEKTFDDGLSLALSLHKSVLGVDIFNYTTVGEALDQLIDVENIACHTTTELSKMIAPNLYGGYSIRYGWLYKPSQNDRTRMISEKELEEGDIILADWSGGDLVYVYLGNSTLATLENGICKIVPFGTNIYQDGDNILITLLGYDRFAVLRPSMTNSLGAQANSDIKPQLIGGRAMLPLRPIFESLGASVSWDEETKTVKVYNESYLLETTIGEATMTVNGVAKKMDNASIIINGRTLVPVEFMAEALVCSR